MGEYPPLIFCQKRQEVIFGSSKFYDIAVSFYGSGNKIYFQIIALDYFIITYGLANSDSRSDPCQQFPCSKGFGKIVGCPVVQRRNNIRFLVLNRQYNNGLVKPSPQFP